MPPTGGSNRLLGAQEGPGRQLILKHNLLGTCPVGSWLGLALRTGDAGFEASRSQSLQRPKVSRFGINEGMGKPGSFKLGGMNPSPKLGLRTLFLFRLTGGPGPDGRVCGSPREPRVLGGSREGICLGEAPLGRPGAGGQGLRGTSWPARSGCGRRAACVDTGEERAWRRTGWQPTLQPRAHSQAPSYLHRRTQLVL